MHRRQHCARTGGRKPNDNDDVVQYSLRVTHLHLQCALAVQFSLHSPTYMSCPPSTPVYKINSSRKSDAIVKTCRRTIIIARGDFLARFLTRRPLLPPQFSCPATPLLHTGTYVANESKTDVQNTFDRPRAVEITTSGVDRYMPSISQNLFCVRT